MDIGRIEPIEMTLHKWEDKHKVMKQNKKRIKISMVRFMLIELFVRINNHNRKVELKHNQNTQEKNDEIKI